MKEIREPEWRNGNQIDGLVYIGKAIIYLAKIIQAKELPTKGEGK